MACAAHFFVRPEEADEVCVHKSEQAHHSAGEAKEVEGRLAKEPPRLRLDSIFNRRVPKRIKKKPREGETAEDCCRVAYVLKGLVVTDSMPEEGRGRLSCHIMPVGNTLS